MGKKDYSVTAGIMELPDGHCFGIGTQEWWNWINSDNAESFRFECDYGVKGYRARKELIKSRSGSFWYAYKRIDGKLRKRYLGKSEELSLERLESAAYDLAKVTEPRTELELPNERVGNHLAEAYEQLRTGAVERENCYSQLLEQKLRLEKQIKELHNELGNCQEELRDSKHRCIHLENENNRLTRLGQDYSHATVAKLSGKYTKALKEIEHWKETSESYKRQAAKLRTEVEELHNTLDNQEDKKAIANLERQVKAERERADEYCSDGLKAATILQEALKFKSNNATPIKARIREALVLIDDI